MRICVVGNSHAGALKRALRRSDRTPHTFDFFVQPGGGGPQLEIRDGRAFMNGPRKQSDWATIGSIEDGLDIGLFDAVIFASGGLPAHRKHFGRHLLNNVVHAGFAETPQPGRQSVSSTVMSLALQRWLLDLGGTRSLRLIRSVFSGPMIVLMCPLPGRHLDKTKSPSDLPTRYGHRLEAFLTWYYREQISVIANEAQAIGAACQPPPEEFLLAGFTPDQFSAHDPWHANEAYGDLQIDNALRLLGA